MAEFKTIVAVLKVADLQRAVDFYTGVLGFAVCWQAANDGGGDNCMLAAGATSVLLSTGSHLGDKPQFTGTLYFNMVGVRAFFEQIKNKVEIVWPLEAMDYGQSEFGIRDPDGYMLAFAEAEFQQGLENGKTNMSRNPTINSPHQGRTVAVVGDVYRFLATGEDTNGKYALFEAFVFPGGGPPLHVHSREEEGFYVLEGEITFFVGDQRLVASAGTFANMPVGTLHSFKNESGKPARMLISVAPAGLEKKFFEVGVSVPPGATTATPATKEEIEKMLAVAPRYGIEIKLPGH